MFKVQCVTKRLHPELGISEYDTKYIRGRKIRIAVVDFLCDKSGSPRNTTGKYCVNCVEFGKANVPDVQAFMDDIHVSKFMKTEEMPSITTGTNTNCNNFELRYLTRRFKKPVAGSESCHCI